MGQPTNAEVKRAQANRTAPEPVPEREETALDFCCGVEGGSTCSWRTLFFKQAALCGAGGTVFHPGMHACMHPCMRQNTVVDGTSGS